MVVAFLLALAAPVRASDPVGIYAIIDRVELEPSASAPERVRLWGVFALADRSTRDYSPPQRGFLYCKLDGKNIQACRREWADLEKLAGTRECVALGSRYGQKVTVRKGGDPTKDPDVYPLGVGLERIPASRGMSKLLRSVPEPITPVEEQTVSAGKVVLRVRSGARDPEGAKTSYVFEIQNSAGKTETSAPIAEGEQETTWQPKMEIRAGEKYTWRVWIQGRNKGPVVSTTFTGKAGL
jgi:hypothetical protein